MIRIGFHDLFFLWLTTVLYHIQRELSTSTALSHSITHRPSRTSCRSWVSLLNWIIFLLLQQHAAPGQIFSIHLFGVSPYSSFNSGPRHNRWHIEFNFHSRSQSRGGGNTMSRTFGSKFDCSIHVKFHLGHADGKRSFSLWRVCMFAIGSHRHNVLLASIISWMQSE